jgi:hypothetical protein
MTTTYFKIGEQEELARFKKASLDLVRRAKKDRSVARQFLQDIGYFEMMPSSELQPKNSSSAVQRNSTKR